MKESLRLLPSQPTKPHTLTALVVMNVLNPEP